jgi:hypothetical protein
MNMEGGRCLSPQRDLPGNAAGWGLIVGSNIKISSDVLRVQIGAKFTFSQTIGG